MQLKAGFYFKNRVDLPGEYDETKQGFGDGLDIFQENEDIDDQKAQEAGFG